MPNTNDRNNDVDQSNNNNSSQNTQQQNNECTLQYFKRYMIRNIPVNFLNSIVDREAILQCIDNIETLQASQQEVDKMYENVCNAYYKEMDLWFKSNNVNSVSKKKFRNSSKTIWNDELTKLWKNLCTAESEYLASHQMSRTRGYLLNKFKQNQNIFDKLFR